MGLGQLRLPAWTLPPPPGSLRAVFPGDADDKRRSLSYQGNPPEPGSASPPPTPHNLVNSVWQWAGLKGQTLHETARSSEIGSAHVCTHSCLIQVHTRTHTHM